MRCAHGGAILLMVGALTAWFCAPAAAELISIDCTGLNLKFDGGRIYDAASSTGGSGSTSDATSLAAVYFYLNGQLKSSMSSGVCADIYVGGVPGVPISSSPDSPARANGGGYVDLLSSSGPVLRLSLTKAIILRTGDDDYSPVSVIAMASGITEQHLPDGWYLNPSAKIEIQLNPDVLSNPVISGGLLTGFSNGAGTAQIDGTVIVPEPGSLAMLLAMALSGLAFWRVRR
jgi:hypothetical protein